MKNKKQVENILKKVAERDGVSVEHVLSEIKKAVDIGMSNPDPRIRLFWMNIPHEGTCPTPEEVLIFLSTRINKQLQ